MRTPRLLLSFASLSQAGMLALLLIRWCPVQGEGPLWEPVTRDTGNRAGIQNQPSIPGLRQARLVRLNRQELERRLAADLALEIPLPQGGSRLVRLRPNPILPAGLARRYPSIRTFAVSGADPADPTQINGRVDWSPLGLHGQLRIDDQTILIAPYHYRERPVREHLVFERTAGSLETDYPPEDLFETRTRRSNAPRSVEISADPGLYQRRFRIALSATGEFTRFHGGRLVDGLAAVVSAVNRLDGVLLREAGIRLQLVAHNDRLIFTNPDTDPFPSQDPTQLINANQQLVDQQIGNDNYDLAMVLNTVRGGSSYLRSACASTTKGRAKAGNPVAIGDPLWVDFIAHEIGHQFGANHIFNGIDGYCEGNRAASTAYEPGSGSSIMGYAGIACPLDNLQTNRDDYFNAANLDEIQAFLASAASCAELITTDNHAPLADAGPDHSLPVGTPFRLQGTGWDPDGDSLTYSWEQHDLGPAGHWYEPQGDAPLFRSLPPSSKAARYFPDLTALRQGQQPIGERLPDYARDLHLRLTLRDQRGGRGSDEVTLHITDSAGPFRVLEPAGATNYLGGNQLQVTWEVAGTDQPPIHCTQVDLLISSGANAPFDQALALATPNDGRQTIRLPDQRTSGARIQVRCSDNLFFALSPADFGICQQPTNEPLRIDSASLDPQPSNRFDSTDSIASQGQIQLQPLTELHLGAPRVRLTNGFHALPGSSVTITTQPSARCP